MLYRVLAAHLETFLARVEANPDRGDLPRFVVRELRAFLDCGQLARGFCRVHCAACGRDDLVAFSCKRRGFCPSCGTRRMVDTAAHLVDCVLPDDVPVRQWVLALPHRVRFLCAFNPDLCAGVRRIFIRAISSFYRSRARHRGVADPRTGCVSFVQRFDSALRLNVHFHILWPDGVFTARDDDLRTRADFHEADPPSDEDIEQLARAVRHRVLRWLRKRGVLPADDSTTDTDEEPSPLAALAAASVQGKIALGHNAGRHARRIGRGPTTGAGFRRGKLCADCDGFSLHAAVRIPEFCHGRLEKLARYAARPPLVHERLSLSKDGTKVIYKLKRRYRDGSTHVVLDCLDFIGRLAALVPRPRVHLTTYHGVFAPAASLRDRVVPPPPPPAVDETPDPACSHRAAVDEDDTSPATASNQPPPSPHRADGDDDATLAAAPHQSPRRYSWAELMRRVHRIDVLVCQHCGGKRRVLAFLRDPAVVDRILRHLGLPTEPPVVAQARPPPEPGLPFA